MFDSVNPREDLIKLEKKALKFWKENKIFERSIQNRTEAPVYSFFDGPPFATGVPHYGTILSSIAKDVVPRYWTMKGYRVDRRWGWDCHGLPAEHGVEKKLGLKSKNEIETKIGIKEFNTECRLQVSQMTEEWEEIIGRIGRWVDYKNPYRTMDKGYMESVWWAFKELYEKDLIYEDTRISLYCPRCETPLANFEIAMDDSYKDVEDISVIVKFKITEGQYKDNSLLAWTTTPWTLPANTALAVGKDIQYVRVKTEKRETLIIAKDRIDQLTDEYAVLEEIKGSELAGIAYSAPYDGFSFRSGKEENLHRVFLGDFVSTKEGTGIVHLAPAFGEDDFNLSRQEEIPLIENVDSQANFKEGPWQGENVWKVNPKIITDLEEKKILYNQQKVVHSYPFCYRCHTKLVYKTQPAWFINIDKIRKKLETENEKINWQPNFLKHGRFLKGIQSAPDWNIARDRYWGTAIPIWRCDKCKKIKAVGSYEELYRLSGQKLDDYHRPYIDKVDFKCDCGGTFKRVPQVLDCWFESGAMPYAQHHYPFENKEDFSQKFPADYISEYIAQTRAWFYVLHVLAVALIDQPAFKNVVATGVISGDDGKKMSKSLGNYTDPKIVLDEYGGDALRLYLMSSPIMEARNINFSVKEIAEVKKKFMSTLWNSYSFFVTYASIDKFDPKEKLNFEEAGIEPKHILDRWILAELNTLISNFEKKMDGYQIAKAARLLPSFIDKLSNWYIRRSRRRFWKSENDNDKNEAYATLYEVLIKFSQVLAPFMPFMAENIYKNLTREESVHLTDYPKANKELIDKDLIKKMRKAQNIVKLVLGIRAEAGIKVRQPLERIYLNQEDIYEDAELKEIIKEETNIKQFSCGEHKEIKSLKKIQTKEENKLIVGLDIQITPKLKKEGNAREIIRHIQEMRRKANYKLDDRISINYVGANAIFTSFEDLIAKETLAKKITKGMPDKTDLEGKMIIADETIKLAITKA
ncbi:MAG: isoleucine--tRNA ligase [Patescibacteria group bacterium]|nr:isoleucine--tRNA ligase [Patescibacteria group bacterium]